MNRIANSLFLGILTAGTLALSAGCQNTTYAHNKVEPITISVSASSTKVLVGETVTLLPRTSDNTLGHDPKVAWTTTGGTLKTVDPGPAAQVTFDKPGTYSVEAKLSADGHVVDTATTVISVSPLPTAAPQ